jgi:hypothetical protein
MNDTPLKTEVFVRGRQKAENTEYRPDGLTIREYFAAHALQGILASCNYTRFVTPSTRAVQMADALIEELLKPTNDTTTT